MTKSIKVHEENYVHISKYGFWMGLIKLPFNLLLVVIVFPLVFLFRYIASYDGTKPIYHKNFVYWFFGMYDTDKYELIKIKRAK